MIKKKVKLLFHLNRNLFTHPGSYAVPPLPFLAPFQSLTRIEMAMYDKLFSLWSHSYQSKMQCMHFVSPVYANKKENFCPRWRIFTLHLSVPGGSNGRGVGTLGLRIGHIAYPTRYTRTRIVQANYFFSNRRYNFRRLVRKKRFPICSEARFSHNKVRGTQEARHLQFL